MRSHLRCGVVTAVLPLQEHAGKVELHDSCGLLRGQLPLEVHELAIAFGKTPLELPRKTAEEREQIDDAA